jgi:protein-disulfide isomerase
MKTRVTIAILSVLVGALGSFGLAACGSRPATDSLSRRVEHLEKRDAQHEDTERRLARIEAQSAEIMQLVQVLAARLDGFDSRLAALAEQQAHAAPPKRPHGLDAAQVYAVPVGDSPVEGPADAKVTIVKAYEFACPFSERSRATMAEVRRHYGKDVRIVYKQYIVHPAAATIPAQAACAAHMQGKHTEMKEAIWENGFKANRNLSEENMLEQAHALGLNMKRFEADMRGPCVKRVEEEHQRLRQLGISGTPTFFINGRYLGGAQPFENFKALIDEELAKANQIIRTQGVKPSEYYETQVVARGRKEQ